MTTSGFNINDSLFSYHQIHLKTNLKIRKKITRSDFLKLEGIVGALATLPSFIPFGKVFGGTNN